MDLKLKISQKEGINMSTLIKEMYGLKCRIKMDTEQGNLNVLGIDENEFETIINSITKSFDINAVEIIPSVEIPEPIITEESIEFQKIEFFDEEVEKHIHWLMKVIGWMITSGKATSRDMCYYLKSTVAEIKMKYAPNEKVNFSVGDVVDCNYGSHLSGEISGGHILSIVCDIEESGMAYIVPITKRYYEYNPLRCWRLKTGRDVNYFSPEYSDGTLLVSKGRWVRSERINSIQGNVNPEFFAKLLDVLPKTITFSHEDYAKTFAEKYGDVQNDDDMLLFGVSDENTFEKTQNADESKSDFSENNDNTTPKCTVKRSSAKEFIEFILLKNEFDWLDVSKPISEQIDVFLEKIGFTPEQEFIKDAFIISVNEDKSPSYDRMSLRLKKAFPEYKVNYITESLKQASKDWLSKYPELKKQYPKVSIMDLLYVFAKKMKQN